jgi:hypothetical protein
MMHSPVSDIRFIPAFHPKRHSDDATLWKCQFRQQRELAQNSRIRTPGGLPQTTSVGCSPTAAYVRFAPKADIAAQRDRNAFTVSVKTACGAPAVGEDRRNVRFPPKSVIGSWMNLSLPNGQFLGQ